MASLLPWPRIDFKLHGKALPGSGEIKEPLLYLGRQDVWKESLTWNLSRR